MTPALPAPRLAQWWHWIVSAVRPLANSPQLTVGTMGNARGAPEKQPGVVTARPALSPDTKRLLLAVGIAHTRGSGGRFS